MKDVYYNPEYFDLIIVKTLEEEDLSYEFNMFIIFQHKDKRLFYAKDIGCSCPSPFEDYTHLKHLTEITKMGFSSFVTEFESWCEYAKIDNIKKKGVIEQIRKLLE